MQSKHAFINLIVVFVFLFSTSFFAGCNIDPGDAYAASETVFGPVGAGFWYPGEQDLLRRVVDMYIAKAGVGDWRQKKVLAVIAPHAGYRYSGQCAGYSFKVLKRQDISRVLVLAPSHRSAFRGMSVLKADFYQTPLGKIKIDRPAVDALLKEDLVQDLPGAFSTEHAVENMLPFLQRSVRDFSLIPAIVGQLNDEDYDKLAGVLKKYIDEKTVLVVSSDFTHFGSHFNFQPFPADKNAGKKIKNLDAGAIKCITERDYEAYRKYLEKTKATICGRIPIGLLIKILPEDAKGKMLHYYASGDASRDYRHSVSYAAIVFYKE